LLVAAVGAGGSVVTGSAAEQGGGLARSP